MRPGAFTYCQKNKLHRLGAEPYPNCEPLYQQDDCDNDRGSLHLFYQPDG
jgi:hypothetical protein